ncbi:MAG: hypothetical protein P0Y48_09310 [Candidatus Microbacterium phytovorans]|uniref:Uncharacterized protein n=1 Tax=Candidatus Microbacterium phytovorans TaxID=3121374 RepID=A0AAJ5VYL9_9MICO|nr:hypothetical protein [Microbacterium sp.]WEK12669.1 MAG: hypothetical protein P0Y48_09310 [Microbacterium sp.]
MRRSTQSTFIACLVACGVIFGGGGSATAAEVDPRDGALAQFRENLTASSDIAAFDELTRDQRSRLSSYLLGEIDPFAELSSEVARTPSGPPTSVSAGGFELTLGTRDTAVPKVAASTGSTTPSGQVSTLAGSTRSVSRSSSFSFLGITISKTTVRVVYYYSGSRATGIASSSCKVDVNYDPFSTVTSEREGAWISSGKATAECKVVVVRGIFSSWGVITWSTKAALQFVTANGYGTVTAYGWR